MAELKARRGAQDLFWDQSFAISRRLRAEHPDVDLAAVGLSQVLIGWLRSRISLMTRSYATKACWPQFTKIGRRS